jgi:DNA-binding response OmpR family regulator
VSARIAVVDDEQPVVVLIESFLRQAGYETSGFVDAAQALEWLRQQRADLVISDVVMAGMDGYALLGALRGDPRTASCPVLFLTGRREFTERVKAFQSGVVDYLAKPVSRAGLLAKVERILAANGRPGLRTEAGEPHHRTDPAVAPPAPVERDPPALPDSPAGLPSFDSVPDIFRDVLVVDDNPQFRSFLKNLLASHGFTVHEATDGEEGLRLALEQQPWLILSDVRMPGDDGFAFCRRVRAHSLLRQTPLLFLSGWDDYQRRYEGLQAGADDFLSKETSVRELLIRIQLLMRRYAELGPRAGGGSGMAGAIEVVGAPGLLQVCHLTRLTGVLEAERGAARARLRFRQGELVGAECEQARDRDAVFALLAWDHGRFRFTPEDPGAGDALEGTFGELLLEGCRRLDESRKATGS